MSSELIKKKLAELPTSAGVYFYRNIKGEIIYIGKAANLRARVRQYFRKSRPADLKTQALVQEISDVDWTELDSEIDALFLEAELIRRYQPRYNILLRDDKSLLYVRIDYRSDYPTVGFVRRPLDDGAKYFGPYLNSFAVKKALRYLRRIFPYATARPVGQKRASLHYHLGLDPGLEEGRTSLADYRSNLRKLMQYLRGDKVTLATSIEKDMKKAAAMKDFEKAALLRNQLTALRELSRQILFSDRENLDISRDEALSQLSLLLQLPGPPRRIEGFDVSHIQGSDTVASMVVFTNGVPYKTAYRKFKMRTSGNDDFAHIYEVLARRFSEKNRAKWGLPNLVLVDGGKGQLKAALSAIEAAQLKIPAIGLAKRHEQIIIHKTKSCQKLSVEKAVVSSRKMGATVKETNDFLVITMPNNSSLLRLLQRIRDESHRFAVAYHTTLRKGRQTSSGLDQIPGIGPATRKKLIRHFGSSSAVLAASQSELQAVLGSHKGISVAGHIAAIQPVGTIELP